MLGGYTVDYIPHHQPFQYYASTANPKHTRPSSVVGEFVGSNSGIGYVLQVANGNFDLPLMFAALVVLSSIGVVLFVAVDLVERVMIPWHASQRHAN